MSDLIVNHAGSRSRTRPPYPTVSHSVAWITNLPYVTGGGPQQQIDLYIPTNGNGGPLVVYVHGGGWEHGDKAGDSVNPNNLQWLWKGYAMASINYRLAPSALWPAQIQDCKAAIRWLKARGHEYGYGPKRIAVVGESAGGHLAAMLGTTTGSKIFDVGENLDYPSDVVCAVNLFGVSDLTRLRSAAATLLGQEAAAIWISCVARVRFSMSIRTNHRCSLFTGPTINWFPTTRPRRWLMPWIGRTLDIIYIP